MSSQIVKTGFRKALALRQEKVKSLACVGLDPLAEKLPPHLNTVGFSLAKNIGIWMGHIAEATANYACMFKPQIGCWEAIPPAGSGIEALGLLIEYIHKTFPDIPVFLDCKRGDIDRTQKQYGIAGFDLLGADGMNFSPYMGKSCMAGLVDKENLGRALVGLCYTSNPSARQIQDLIVTFGMDQLKYLWEVIAEDTLGWAKELGVAENAGLVMAAAYQPTGCGNDIISSHLERCRKLVGDKLWFLIPGVGAQGGFIEETIRASYMGPGTIAINSSSEINFASSDLDFAEAAARKAKELRNKINLALE